MAAVPPPPPCLLALPDPLQANTAYILGYLSFFVCFIWWLLTLPPCLLALPDLLQANTAYILGYLSFIVCFIFLLLCRDAFFSIWHIRGSTRLHNQLFARVLKAPILFFLRTPVGDVLSSFAKDQDTLDETLPDTLHM